MELRQLEYFVAVVEQGGFTRAAQALRVAQPGVSAQVGKLERELGQVLLVRGPRSVRLTEAGRAVLPHAREALDAAQRVRAAADEIGGLLRGSVTMGMITSTASFGLPELFEAFHADHPAIEISLTEARTDELVDAVREGRLDVALVSLAPGERPEGLAVHEIVDEPLVAAVPEGHRWAGRAEVSVRDLVTEPLICLPRGTGGRTRLEEACAAAGVVPRVSFEASLVEMLVRLAARGLGVAIVPESLVPYYPLHSVRIGRPAMRGRLGLVWRSPGPLAPAARAFVAVARERLVAPGS